jgi:hypothetical protein
LAAAVAVLDLGLHPVTVAMVVIRRSTPIRHRAELERSTPAVELAVLMLAASRFLAATAGMAPASLIRKVALVVARLCALERMVELLVRVSVERRVSTLGLAVAVAALTLPRTAAVAVAGVDTKRRS